jgi:hypothetical protein
LDVKPLLAEADAEQQSYEAVRRIGERIRRLGNKVMNLGMTVHAELFTTDPDKAYRNKLVAQSVGLLGSAAVLYLSAKHGVPAHSSPHGGTTHHWDAQSVDFGGGDFNGSGDQVGPVANEHGAGYTPEAAGTQVPDAPSDTKEYVTIDGFDRSAEPIDRGTREYYALEELKADGVAKPTLGQIHAEVIENSRLNGEANPYENPDLPFIEGKKYRIK